MSGEQALFNLEIKKNSGLSLNPDIHHSKVVSSVCINWLNWVYEKYFLLLIESIKVKSP